MHCAPSGSLPVGVLRFAPAQESKCGGLVPVLATIHLGNVGLIARMRSLADVFDSRPPYPPHYDQQQRTSDVVGGSGRYVSHLWARA